MTLAPITEPQEAADYLFKLIEDKQDELGIGYLGLNERLTPNYPCVIVYPGNKQQVPHATHLFRILMSVELMIYHASFKDSTPTRTRENMMFVSKLEDLIHLDMEWDNRIVFAYVSEHIPRVARRPTSEMVVGTQMTVLVESRKGFPYVP